MENLACNDLTLSRSPCDRTSAMSEPQLSLPDSHRRYSVNQRGTHMFKIIGATVVYGLALFGLAKYLEATKYEST